MFSFRHSGFKLAVVHHLDMPLMNQIGINIAPGTDVQVAIIPTIIDTDEEASESNKFCNSLVFVIIFIKTLSK